MIHYKRKPDVQYLEAPNDRPAAGSYRLMFKANTPLKEPYSPL